MAQDLSNLLVSTSFSSVRSSVPVEGPAFAHLPVSSQLGRVDSGKFFRRCRQNALEELRRQHDPAWGKREEGLWWKSFCGSLKAGKLGLLGRKAQEKDMVEVKGEDGL